ncbi:MAG: ABC transporter permease [Saprospiraceae bacterium]|nr:ABC transporter permease [Bacteroidia bacterium]NNE15686.1 ABC transporter permease [Saprospiraceae bacterium]NNL93585.1 ABC transporter permease [Saprospiraceae bacterium]
MFKIFKYSFFDMIRNRWMFIYMGFFLLVTTVLLMLSNDVTKVIISLTNIIQVLTPLIGILFGTMYYYSSREFIELLLTQPLSRKSVFAGVYLGLAMSLSLSLVLGVTIPMLFFGVFTSSALSTFLTLLAMSVVLSIVFSLLAFLIAIRYEDKTKGFGVAIFTWLFFGIIYDGIFLMLLLVFKEYPLEKLTITLTFFNPIDLARILIILKLEISAMMGYTGAVLQKFLGSLNGTILITVMLTLWTVIPFALMLRKANKKDF